VDKNFKKENLIKDLSLKTGYPKNFSKKLVNDLIDVIINNIKLDNLNLKNIGTFRIINKKERIGRNPKTNEIYTISPRRSIVFTSSKTLVKNLN